MVDYENLKLEYVIETVDLNSSVEYFHAYALFCERVIIWLKVIAGLVGSGGLTSLIVNVNGGTATKVAGGVFLSIGVIAGVLIQHTPYKKRKEKIDIINPKFIDLRTWAETEYDKLKVSSIILDKKIVKLINLKKSLKEKLQEVDSHWHGVQIPKDCKNIFKKSELETINYARMKFPEYDFSTELEKKEK